MTTRWWPSSRPAAAVVNPVLWLNGTDSRLTSPLDHPQRIVRSAAGSLLSPPASISLGRPVLPPEVIDFHTGETASGSGASDSAASGVKSIGTLGTSPRGSDASDEQRARLQIEDARRTPHRAAGQTAAAAPRRASSTR